MAVIEVITMSGHLYNIDEIFTLPLFLENYVLKSETLSLHDEESDHIE